MITLVPILKISGLRSEPLCHADTDSSGSITVQDLLDFLNLWFGNNSIADLNGDGAITVMDIFRFLELYFSGCSSPLLAPPTSNNNSPAELASRESIQMVQMSVVKSANKAMKLTRNQKREIRVRCKGARNQKACAERLKTKLLSRKAN